MCCILFTLYITSQLCCNQGFVIKKIADCGVFFKFITLNIKMKNKCTRREKLLALVKVRMSILVHFFTVLPPVGHVLPPSEVLLAAKSAARWTPL